MDYPKSDNSWILWSTRPPSKLDRANSDLEIVLRWCWDRICRLRFAYLLATRHISDFPSTNCVETCKLNFCGRIYHYVTVLDYPSNSAITVDGNIVFHQMFAQCPSRDRSLTTAYCIEPNVIPAYQLSYTSGYQIYRHFPGMYPRVPDALKISSHQQIYLHNEVDPETTYSSLPELFPLAPFLSFLASASCAFHASSFASLSLSLKSLFIAAHIARFSGFLKQYSLTSLVVMTSSIQVWIPLPSLPRRSKPSSSFHKGQSLLMIRNPHCMHYQNCSGHDSVVQHS